MVIRRFVLASRNMFLAGVSGLLLVCSFPGFDYAGLVWMALVPLLVVLRSCRLQAAFGFSFLTGAIFFTGMWWWWLSVDEIHAGNFLLAILFNALYFGLFGLGTSFFYARGTASVLLALPTLWVLLEYLRSHLFFLAFPWGLLGYTQYQVLPVATLAALTGVYGVSFLIVLVNGLVTELSWAAFTSFSGRLCSPVLVTRRPFLPLVPMAGFSLFMGATVLWGFAGKDERSSSDTLNVAAVQGNVYTFASRNPERRQAVLQTYQDLSLRAASLRPDLIVWPSSSVPGRLPADAGLALTLSQVAQTTGSHVLVGAAGYDKLQPQSGKPRGLTNSAFLFSPPGGLVGRYDKNRLLPFGEYLPLRKIVPWPSWIISQQADTVPGDRVPAFRLHHARFVVQICWENLFPDVIRQVLGQEVEFLVSMTNESFTSQPSAHYQMLAMYVFRAIENHIAIVRSATTGISALIGPTGQILTTVRNAESREVDVEGFVVGTIPLSTERTFYTRHGDWLIAGLLVLFLSILTMEWFHAQVGSSGLRRYENT